MIGIICTAVAAGSFALQQRLQRQYSSARETLKLHRIPADLEAMERSGKPVKLADLEGKVRVFAYVYTVCPHGCASVIGEMLKLQKKFGDRTDFHQVCVSVLPERDDAATMSAFAEGIGLKKGAPWWFLTGDRAKLWSFMTDGLQLEAAKPIPEEERLNPLDFYSHDLRIVLVDRQGFARGYYAVFHPQSEIAAVTCEQLQEDAQRLLDDPNL